ncbi:hypothetical protein [Candidatus Cyanaurora vandensis]|uniref:hypothetical protein n=1 Tax=Candidatus Cyanaurora vandensis TaxID=2714958 RepID=UPI002580A563|nr:hypothetical protein [Candidatus Cyanaurora vandensis]
MEVILMPHPTDQQFTVLNILWQGRVMHSETFPSQRASRISRLWAEAGYLVTRVTEQSYRLSTNLFSRYHETPDPDTYWPHFPPCRP